MSRASGLRNRHRPNGRSPYARQGKHNSRDTYGQWDNGRQVRTDVIAGRNMPYYNKEKAQ